MTTPPPSADVPGTRTLTDAETLAALANPTRARMVDALTVDGPSTASALAQRTDQAVGSASHHLKVLAAAGLVEPAPELARDRRERWWRLTSVSTRWSRAEFADDPAAVTAAHAAEAVALQRQFERSQAWLATDENTDWDSAAFAQQSWLRLRPDELAALSAELLAVVHRWRDRASDPADTADTADSADTAAGDRRDVFVFARGFPASP